MPPKKKVTSSVVTVGVNGQISLGKRHAGQTVLVEQLGDGGVLIKSIAAVVLVDGTTKTLSK